VKLTPRSQGYRFTHKLLLNPGDYVDIHLVGRTIVTATDQEGKIRMFERDDMDKDWVRVGSTRSQRQHASDSKLP
jgi:hypothetical protein